MMVLPDPGNDVVREVAFMAIVDESKSIGDLGLVGGVEGMAPEAGQRHGYESWCFEVFRMWPEDPLSKHNDSYLHACPNLKRHPLYTANENDIPN